MDVHTAVSAAAIAVVVATLALASPAVGIVDVGGPRSTHLGEGTATVDRVTLEHRPVVTAGRFGTGVAYLRVPDAEVRVSSVTGRSRLVYRVTVPALGFDRVSHRRLSPDASGTVTVRMADRAFEYGSVDRKAYAATLTLAVQSFAADRTVYRRNVTVEVHVDGE